jgi:hypothetical protein
MAHWNTLNARLSALSISLLLTIAGCDGGDGGSSSATSPPGSSPSWASGFQVVETSVSGSVGDGPIAGARLRVRTNSGSVIAETTSTETADYNLVIKTQGKNYALTIEADQGVDLVTGMPPDFALLSAIMKPSSRTVSNLNPFTTLIYGAARHAGGINDSSVASINAAVVSRYGFGLDTAIVPDPTNSPINDGNVHVIVKTSETLGEMIRRTRDALYIAGGNLDGDGIVNALAADLVDGWIDGAGASGQSTRVAAVANVASGAVLVQAMANRLHVYGYDATRAMDDAIRIVQPSAPASSSTANVGVPAEALRQAVRSLFAAAVLVDDPRISDTIAVLMAAPPGALPSYLAPQFPAGIDEVLDEAVRRASLANDSQLAQVNATAKTDPSAIAPPAEGGAPANQPPTISGSPDTAIVVGNAWSFQPSASDPDGDALSFSVSNKPDWASFDPATGRLSGTPGTAGEYGPVTITVSDGQATTSLDPFTLHVSEPTVGNATVSWTPPTERADGSALTDLAGYKVYFGTDPTRLGHVVNLSNAGLTSYMVENLEPATWYFAVTAYDKAGLESAKSNIASKTIN